jgi:hypothetical protein
VVIYASPNAISAYRRLGVSDNGHGAQPRRVRPRRRGAARGPEDGEPLESEVEARGAVVLRRLLPLTRGHQVLGGLMLVREVTELRRHERLLLYKDATIREIHHRVKNNLQTVASLLRLQSRRLPSGGPAGPGESVRRISSIALVHETLSQDSGQRVAFDKVAHRLIDMLTTGLTDPEHPVRSAWRGPPASSPPRWPRRWRSCCPSCSRTRSSTRSPTTLAGALEGATLVLGQPAPDAGVLVGGQRELEALLADVAASADALGGVRLLDGRAGRPDREEQLGVLVGARDRRVRELGVRGTIAARGRL